MFTRSLSTQYSTIMGSSEFSRLLRESGYTPSRYARTTGFHKCNVLKWLSDDERIPEDIRSIVLSTLDLNYTEKHQKIKSPNAWSRRHNMLYKLSKKVKPATRAMVRRDGKYHISGLDALEDPFDGNMIFRDFLTFIAEGKLSERSVFFSGEAI